MKTAVKDAMLSDMEAVSLASVILGVQAGCLCDLKTEHVCISAQPFLTRVGHWPGNRTQIS